MAVQDISVSPHSRPSSAATLSILARLNGFLGMFLTRRFATFVVFGGLAAVVNLAVGRALYSLPSTSALLPYWVAVALASAAGLLVNFSLNYAFNFGYRGRSAGAQLRTFVMVAMGGVALTALLASLVRALAAWSGVPAMLEVAGTALSVEFLAHVIAVGLVTFYSFVGHSVLSFNAGLRAFLRRLPALNQFQRRAL